MQCMARQLNWALLQKTAPHGTEQQHGYRSMSLSLSPWPASAQRPYQISHGLLVPEFFPLLRPKMALILSPGFSNLRSVFEREGGGGGAVSPWQQGRGCGHGVSSRSSQMRLTF